MLQMPAFRNIGKKSLQLPAFQVLAAIQVITASLSNPRR